VNRRSFIKKLSATAVYRKRDGMRERVYVSIVGLTIGLMIAIIIF
jgi:hypothetical protein